MASRIWATFKAKTAGITYARAKPTIRYVAVTGFFACMSIRSSNRDSRRREEDWRAYKDVVRMLEGEKSWSRKLESEVARLKVNHCQGPFCTSPAAAEEAEL